MVEQKRKHDISIAPEVYGERRRGCYIVRLLRYVPGPGLSCCCSPSASLVSFFACEHARSGVDDARVGTMGVRTSLSRCRNLDVATLY